jgi:hypothetical protein
MPTRSSPSTTGTPEMWCARVSASTSPMLMSGRAVIGFLMTPASNFLTRSTSAAWRSVGMFLWMMPMPPCSASVMARRDSVTVSMAADSSGMRSRMPRVTCVPRSTSRGRTSE